MFQMKVRERKNQKKFVLGAGRWAVCTFMVKIVDDIHTFPPQALGATKGILPKRQAAPQSALSADLISSPMENVPSGIHHLFRSTLFKQFL